MDRPFPARSWTLYYGAITNALVIFPLFYLIVQVHTYLLLPRFEVKLQDTNSLSRCTCVYGYITFIDILNLFLVNILDVHTPDSKINRTNLAKIWDIFVIFRFLMLNLINVGPFDKTVEPGKNKRPTFIPEEEEILFKSRLNWYVFDVKWIAQKATFSRHKGTLERKHFFFSEQYV